MEAKEFVKKFGWDEAKARINNNIDMFYLGWGFYSGDLKTLVDAWELVGDYVNRDNGRWFFIADYCSKSKLLSPFDADVYNMVGDKYDKAVELVEQCQ